MQFLVVSSTVDVTNLERYHDSDDPFEACWAYRTVVGVKRFLKQSTFNIYYVYISYQRQVVVAFQYHSLIDGPGRWRTLNPL
jgi:hypothetical protein